MATLHLRDVPDQTMDQLRRLAHNYRTSMNAVAVQELVEAARRVDNPALLASLPDLKIDQTEIIGAIEADRAVG